MAELRALSRIGWGTLHVFALVTALIASVLGTFPGQAASVSIPLQSAETVQPLAIQAQTDLPFKFYLPSVNFSRDDLMLAESNLVVTTISAGYAHACAIRPSGDVICWGLNDDGQATPEPGLFTQISGGGSHTCGVREDGMVACWGDNTSGQSNAPEGAFTQVSAGGLHSCAIRADGTLACWGSNALGQLNNIPTGTFTQVAAGNLHTCALTTSGTLACWGSNNYGQSTPPAGTFTQVSAGGFHSCALAENGAVTCWGFNDAGQTSVPDGTYSAVGAGYLHTCAMRLDGTLACWGSNGFGQISNIPEGEFQQLSAGGNHSCALRATGTPACWGWNRYGQSFPPSGVMVSVGDGHTCALLPDGLLSCWGENTYGQATPPAGAFLRVSAGARHTCGVDILGDLSCWGDDRAGQSAAPDGTFLDVSAGEQHSCAIDPDGTLVCWGDNRSGQSTAPSGVFTRLDAGARHTCALGPSGALTCFGDNSYGQSTVPAGTYTQVSAGGRHTCTVNVQGQLSCFGDNSDGQTVVPSGTFAQVSAGAEHTCAVSALGAVFCWGDNTYGQTNAPAGEFAQVSAGTRTSCAVRLDGSVECWGGNAAPTITLSPESLPDALVDEAYSQAFSASGGTDPYTFTLSAGALPAGLELSPEGVLSGTPQEAGGFTFTVQAADSSNPAFTGQREYTLTVAAPGDSTPPVITPRVTGTEGNNGWYISDVTVAWEVRDPESPITSTSGCEETTITEDTTGQTLTCTATSAGGTSSASVTVKIDQTAPTGVQAQPSRQPDQNGWYKRPLTVTYTGQDATSGIASCTEVTYTGPDSAQASVSGTCTDNAGNTSAPVSFTFPFDDTAPMLNPVVEPNPVYLNGKAKVIPNASDATSGLASVECGSVDTRTVGKKEVTCTAADQAGNRVRASVSYYVIYRFSGFLPPVDNPPAWNRVVAGQTVPLKFRLADASGKPVTNLPTFAVDLEFVACPAGLDEAAQLDELYLPEVNLNQGSGQYHYNWQTNKAWAGRCKVVTIDLGEGIQHQAFFWFWK